jgi:hypothetical protein
MNTIELENKQMTQVILSVKNNKYPFFLELVKSFDFIKIEGVDTDMLEPKSAKPRAVDFEGLLTESEGKAYHQYLQKARLEWDRDI